MTHTEALKMALELLAVATYHSPDLQAKRTEVIDAGLKALAQPQQEPVAAECKFDREEKWMRCEIAHHNLVQSEPHNWAGYQTRLLYTLPPQRKPLSDEKLLEVIKTIDRDEQFIQQALRHLARAIEAAHGIKE